MPEPRVPAPVDFSLTNKVVVVTGGYGVIGGTMAVALAGAGARVAILGRDRERAELKAREIAESGGQGKAFVGDVLDEAAMRAACAEVLAHWGRVDGLVNAAGGNVARARNDSRAIFEVPFDAFDEVLRLNLHGSVLPSLVFAESMAQQRSGSIVLISSMAAAQAISGVMGYSVAKAGIESFTKWMGVELARKYGDRVRVNAIAPGFFVSSQNRSVLLTSDGRFTPRARAIVDQTPMGRFGQPEELVGATQWLLSDAASFVTGTVVVIDGGFSAYSGV